MTILAIEASGLVASSAIMKDDVIIAEYTTNYKKTHSQTLLPMISEIMEMSGIKAGEIDAIAVSGGPGSFTGLRIGAATAKGIGFVIAKPLVNIPTVDGLAFNVYNQKGIICPLMDARRSQVYSGLYSFESAENLTVKILDGYGPMNVIMQQGVYSVSDIIEAINEIGMDVTFLGDGVAPYRDVLLSGIKTNISFAPAHLFYQHAGSVAQLSKFYLEKGMTVTADEFAPSYLRPSSAEQNRK